jgi:DNA-binding HxlR family transcriptional regulator
MVGKSVIKKASGSKENQSRSAPESGRLKGLQGGLKRSGPPELDRLIHEKVRLGILSALAANESLSFNELKGLLDTTDGNLSVHARKLEEADYVSCLKTFQQRIPRTEYRLTEIGRRALEAYLDHMEALIRSMRQR